MFGDDDNDPFKDFDRKFKEQWDENNKSFERAKHVHDVMSVVVPVLSGLVVLAVIAVCCHVCCRRRSRGRVLAPPTQPGNAAPYPQQQYSVAVSTYPVQGGGVTYAPAAAPAPYPAAAPAPYPAAPAPYPAHAPAPYVAMAPYPAAPYPAPSAPHVDAAFIGIAPPGWNMPAQPPSYDQVQSEMKSAPYNPNYPH